MHCTIIVPAHNTRPWIATALQSAIVQDYPSFDILVVDDGSTDGTGEIVEALMPKGPISLVRHEQRRGVTAATATALRHARGPLCTLLDSDDMLKRNSLATGCTPFTNADVGFVWTRFSTSTGRPGWSNGLPPGQTLNVAMRRGWWRAAHQKFWRLSTYRQTAGLDESIDRSSDFQLVYLLSTTGCRTIHVPKSTYWYRCYRPGSVTSQGRDKQRAAVQAILRRHS